MNAGFFSRTYSTNLSLSDILSRSQPSLKSIVFIPNVFASSATPDPECNSNKSNVVAWNVVAGDVPCTRLISSSSSNLAFIGLPWPFVSSTSSTASSAFLFSHAGSVAFALLGLGAVAASFSDSGFLVCPAGSADFAFALL